MPDNAEKEHYVPKVYLDRFCESPNRVNVYDKICDDIRVNQDYAGVASERNFYDVDLPAYNEELKSRGEKSLDELFPGFKDYDSKHIEHMFGRGIELAYNREIGTVIDELKEKDKWWFNNCFAISKEKKLFFTLWVAHQFIRTKSFREDVSKIQQALGMVFTEYVNKNIPDSDQIKIEARTDKFAKHVVHADMIMDPEILVHVMQELFNHSWIFTVNRSGIPFVTSDNPVVVIPHGTQNGFVAAGLKSPWVEIFFPLSPDVAIMMFEKEYGLENYDRWIVVCEDPEEIKKYNYSMLSNALRSVISNSRELTYLKTYQTDHPEIIDKKINLYVGGKKFEF